LTALLYLMTREGRGWKISDPFYGIGAILSHWVTGLLRDSTGLYNLAFFTNGMMALAGLVLILFVQKKPS
jgi:hypothetical protein